MSNLKNETLYEIKIFWEDSNGDESLMFKTEVRTVASIASKLLKSAEQICDDPLIYRICPIKITNLPEGIQIREFFSDVKNKDERSILLLGARGSGKSTLVDAIINYVTDVAFADNFRLKITDEKKTQGEEDIVCYKIRCQDGLKVRFNLNIIDVPGFESRYNESIYQKLLALFQSVRYISAACLVVPSFCRLTEENRRIFNNILSIFGNDINYVVPFITFDDTGEIKALSSLKAANVPFVEHMHFRFNNSQLFSGNENKEIWNTRQTSMQNLFGEPTVFGNFPVEKTRDVLKTRNTIIQDFENSKTLKQQIEQKEVILKDYDLRKRRQQPIQRSVETNWHVRTICINCTMCKQTCVFDCSVKGCLGCQCACSFAHHVKEYGRYRTHERDTLKTVHIIEDQTDQKNEERLQIEKRTLLTELNMIYDSLLRLAEFITTIALHNEPPIEVKNVRKFIESLPN
ncbi:unnamed protein product [Mytilus edulis]|uniref:AIG1-type G domain-containing protein n=1 Tax=Mytilus edulis TaxID=6550 RepID=A0A8S3Q4W6_MYTED|nr:unnamed protein product [Mytilus edulis]